MKLWNVDVWSDWDNQSGATVVVVSEDKESAESKATEDGYYNCAEAEEITEISGYKIILEKINII